jgi:hypothetical protein
MPADDDCPPEVRRLVSYSGEIAAALIPVVARASEAAARLPVTREHAERAAGSGWMLLELALVAAPGDGVWSVNVGVEGAAPAFVETHLSCANVIRDGQPHRYEIEIPLLLAGHVQLYFNGDGVSDPERLRLMPAAIRWPQGDLPPVALPKPQVHASGPNFLSLVYQGLSTLQLA